MEKTVIFCFGAINYMAIEILWRGYTHWTMAIAGGICAVILYVINRKLKGVKILYKCMCGAVFITLAELITGIIINKILRWNVWDYSEKAFNLWGQICPMYFLLWFLLCIPVFNLFEYLQKKI